MLVWNQLAFFDRLSLLMKDFLDISDFKEKGLFARIVKCASLKWSKFEIDEFMKITNYIKIFDKSLSRYGSVSLEI